MKNIRKIAERIESGFASKGIKKYSLHLVAKEKRELTAEQSFGCVLRSFLCQNRARKSIYV